MFNIRLNLAAPVFVWLKKLGQNKPLSWHRRLLRKEPFKTRARGNREHVELRSEPSWHERLLEEDPFSTRQDPDSKMFRRLEDFGQAKLIRLDRLDSLERVRFQAGYCPYCCSEMCDTLESGQQTPTAVCLGCGQRFRDEGQ